MDAGPDLSDVLVPSLVLYTIRKNGQKKIIHQLPLFENGAFAGFVEISIPIPEELPHFDRG